MNRTIVLATLRQRFTSPLRVLILVLIGWLPLLGVVLNPGGGLGGLRDSYGFALVLGAGIVGMDVSSGTLQLLFARPVRRADYIYSKWAAVSFGVALVCIAQVALGALLMLIRHVAPQPVEMLAVTVHALLLGAGTAALMVMLSSLVPGLGDLGLLLVGGVSSLVLENVASAKGWHAVARAAAEVQRFLKPELDVAGLLHGFTWHAPIAYLSTVTLCLAVAILVLNRRELSYASG